MRRRGEKGEEIKMNEVRIEMRGKNEKAEEDTQRIDVREKIYGH